MNDDDLIYGYDMPALDADMLSDLGVYKTGLESIGGDILANMNLGSDIGGLDFSQFNLDSDLFGMPEGAFSLGSEDMAALGDLFGGELTGTDLWDRELGDMTRPLPDYSSLYGTPEEIAAMQDQDQLWSMGAKGVFTDDTEPGSSGGTQGSYGPGGAGELGSYKGASYLPGGATVGPGSVVKLPDGTRVTPGGSVIRSDGTVVRPDGTTTKLSPDNLKKLLAGTGTSRPNNLLGSLLPLLLMMMAMRDKGGSSGTSSAVIPALAATQRQTPYTQIQQAPGYRPGQGGITYFNPVQYAPRMAAGGIADLARGRLLQGKGDGVSDSIPAMIGSDQPARLARGEYVVDARTVAELGNGSTDAGAERLDEMRKRVHSKRKKAKVGQDSKAYKALPA